MNGKKRQTVVLASYPGSGNTWTRELLESTTGICTGTAVVVVVVVVVCVCVYVCVLQKEVVVLTSVYGCLSCIAFYYRSIVQWGCVREISYYLKGHHCNLR